MSNELLTRVDLMNMGSVARFALQLDKDGQNKVGMRALATELERVLKRYLLAQNDWPVCDALLRRMIQNFKCWPEAAIALYKQATLEMEIELYIGILFLAGSPDATRVTVARACDVAQATQLAMEHLSDIGVYDHYHALGMALEEQQPEMTLLPAPSFGHAQDPITASEPERAPVKDYATQDPRDCDLRVRSLHALPPYIRVVQ